MSFTLLNQGRFKVALRHYVFLLKDIRVRDGGKCSHSENDYGQFIWLKTKPTYQANAMTQDKTNL